MNINKADKNYSVLCTTYHTTSRYETNQTFF